MGHSASFVTPFPQPAVNPARASLGSQCSPERFFELSLDLFCIASVNGFLRLVNPSFQRILGWPEESLLARSFYDFIHDDDVKPTQTQMARLQAGVAVLSFENRLLTTERSSRHILWTAYPDPAHGLFYAVGRDITERKRLEMKLRQRTRALEKANARLRVLAETDPLTGLQNRRGMAKHLGNCADRSESMALLLIDIDHFKQVNDSFGHAYGDDVLRTAAKLLKATLPGLVGRVGGEEFAAVLDGNDAANSDLFAGQVLRAFREHPWARGPITVSIGSARLDPARGELPRTAWDELVSEADAALYAAKAAGRNRHREASSGDRS